MADVYTRIGYIKGATGATGATGAKGDTGDAATIQVGSVTTVPYGQTANVVNSGTEQAAVFDFTIPQGRPGQQTTEMDNLLLNSITTSAAEFPLPAVGETGKVLWGKVVKWFSDMAALVATKLNAANVVNNLTTTESGYALDARQGKALNDALASLSANVVADASPRYMHNNSLTANFWTNEVALLLCFSIADGNVSNAYVGMVAIGSPGKTSKVFDIYGYRANLGLTFNWNSTTSLSINMDNNNWGYVAILHAGKNRT